MDTISETILMRSQLSYLDECTSGLRDHDGVSEPSLSFLLGKSVILSAAEDRSSHTHRHGLIGNVKLSKSWYLPMVE